MNQQARRISAGLLLLASLTAIAAVDEPTPEQLDRNRVYLKKLAQHDPEQFARLQRLAEKFKSLPADRREQLLKLDQLLHQTPVPVQSRLQNVAAQYGEWLERLPDAERQKIHKAADREAKLQIIRELREAEWLKHQPKVLRHQIAGLKGPDRAALITRVKKEHRERRQQWAFAALFWDDLRGKKPMPTRLPDFGRDVEIFVNEYLLPRLTKEEKDRLEKAQGRWPDFPVILVEIADRHPPALPGVDGPKYFEDLPTDVKQRLAMKGKKVKEITAPPAIRKAQGKWPEFGQAIVEHIKDKLGPLPNEFLAYKSACLSAPAREFVDKTLFPVLSEDEKRSVNNAENQWPLFPLTLQALAQKHNLQVPWLSLPKGWDDWKKYRVKSLAE